MDTFASIENEKAIMKFNAPNTPCVVQGKDEKGLRLILPVRVV